MIDGGQYRWRKGAPAGQVVFVDEAQKAEFKEATQITVDENIPFKVSSSGTLKHLRVVSGNNDRFVVQRALNGSSEFFDTPLECSEKEPNDCAAITVQAGDMIRIRKQLSLPPVSVMATEVLTRIMIHPKLLQTSSALAATCPACEHFMSKHNVTIARSMSKPETSGRMSCTECLSARGGRRECEHVDHIMPDIKVI